MAQVHIQQFMGVRFVSVYEAPGVFLYEISLDSQTGQTDVITEATPFQAQCHAMTTWTNPNVPLDPGDLPYVVLDALTAPLA